MRGTTGTTGPRAWIAAAALCAGAFAAEGGTEGAPEVVRLKVGSEVVIDVLEFDEAKGVRGRRVDDGALIDIAFDQMAAEDARRIRAAHGYLPDEPEPVLVEAMRVRLTTGQEFVGIIVEQGVETLELRKGAQTWTLRRSGIREIAPIQVDALEVHDGEELYAQELARRNPQQALDHYNLALWCESLQLWTRVREHLARVKELDPAFKADIVASKDKRAELRQESGEDSAELAKAQRFAQRQSYDTALALLDGLLERKPGSALRPEIEKTRKTLERQRAKWLKEQTIVHFFTYLERVARQIANEQGVGYKQARQRMELEGSKLAAEATAKWLKVATEDVERAWNDPERNTASPHYATYGAGTFTLGSIEAIQKGLVDEKDAGKGAEPGAGDDGAEAQDYLDKIKKILEEKQKKAAEAAKNKGKPQEKKKRGPEIADVPPTPEEWWEKANSEERTQYVLAWWADHDPQVQIIRYDARVCVQCTGEGLMRFIDRGGEQKWIPCDRCKTLGIDRILRYH